MGFAAAGKPPLPFRPFRLHPRSLYVVEFGFNLGDALELQLQILAGLLDFSAALIDFAH